MKTKRLSIPAETRRIIMERDNHKCVRCSRVQGLEIHHRIQVKDGGGNETENLLVLCSRCHDEWHNIDAVLQMPFGQWIELPTYNQLLSMWAMEWPDNISAADAKKLIWSAVQLINSDFDHPTATFKLD